MTYVTSGGRGLLFEKQQGQSKKLQNVVWPPAALNTANGSASHPYGWDQLFARSCCKMFPHSSTKALASFQTFLEDTWFTTARTVSSAVLPVSLLCCLKPGIYSTVLPWFSTDLQSGEFDASYWKIEPVCRFEITNSIENRVVYTGHRLLFFSFRLWFHLVGTYLIFSADFRTHCFHLSIFS